MDKPVISMTICTYNQEKYIKECVESALNQTYSPLEIIISDDCSCDSTCDIINRIINSYCGPHKVIFNKNQQNQGISLNLSNAISLSSGKLIVDCGGDDIFEADKVERIYNKWYNAGLSSMALFSNAIIIDEENCDKGLLFPSVPRYCSKIDDFLNDRRSIWKKMSSPSVWVHGATVAYTKDLFDIFGPIPNGTLQEDGVIAFRALLIGKIEYIQEPLTKYRVHYASISNKNNYHNVLKLQRNEYKYFKAQLNDAINIKAQREIIREIKKLLITAYIKRVIFGIPFFNILLVKIIKHRKNIFG